jgi:HEAT repeat protein
MALGEFGPAAEPALAPLFALLQNPYDPAHEDAWCTLGRIGANAVPGLCLALKDPWAEVRLAAVEGLGHMESRAKDATAPLAAALTDPDLRVVYAAATALGRIGPEARAAVAALKELDKDDDRNLQYRVSAALKSIEGSP